jgi:hypothetical protein
MIDDATYSSVDNIRTTAWWLDSPREREIYNQQIIRRFSTINFINTVVKYIPQNKITSSSDASAVFLHAIGVRIAIFHRKRMFKAEEMNSYR